MRIICLWIPGWSTDGAPEPELGALLLETAPRVAVERRGVAWADARGLPAARLAGTLLARLRAAGIEGARAGVASVPVAAEAAARWGAREAGGGERVVEVEPGGGREFLAPLPLSLLEPCARDARSGSALTAVLELLEGVGVETCGALAALPREAVEVRFGPGAVRLWRLARAEDRRAPFLEAPRELPSASLDFVDYVLTDPARLLFTANALLGGITDELRARGRHARRLVLSLALANGGTWEKALKAARPTASRERWLRLLRAELERLTVPDAVAGLGLRVEAVEAAAVRQGDLFDRGFATEAAVEDALARLVEAQSGVVVVPAPLSHPLAERRAPPPATPHDAGTRRGGDAAGAGRTIPASPPPRAPAFVMGGGAAAMQGLTLQLLPEPRPVEVDTKPRRDHVVPVRYRDGGWKGIAAAAGPDRVSGGQWERAYAREYFRCVTADGLLVWLFRDARGGAWYLHGWWD